MVEIHLDARHTTVLVTFTSIVVPVMDRDRKNTMGTASIEAGRTATC